MHRNQRAEELASVVAQLAQELSRTVAVAESLTSGAHRALLVAGAAAPPALPRGA
jgi:nicotinamide mononucleotide (NMN) deamidase PncC